MAQPVLDIMACDVWGRTWLGLKNKKSPAEEATTFQVNVRIPAVCRNTIHHLSGRDGLYVEPRGEDGQTADEQYAVIWLQDKTRSEVVHLLKTTENLF